MAVPKTNPTASEKMAELLVHIAKRSESDPKFGATKLNKLLFYADFTSYLRFGKAITGQCYQKLDHGPAPRALKPILHELEKSLSVATVEREHYGRRQIRTIALRDPNYNMLEARDIALVDDLITLFWDKNAKEISELSHRFVGWQLAAIGEDIPYQVAIVGCRPPTARECEYGRSLEESARELQQS